MPDVNEKVSEFISTIDTNVDNEWIRSSIVDDARQLGGVTNELKDDFAEFLQIADLSGDIMEQYQIHLQNTSNNTSNFSDFISKAKGILKSFGETIASIGVNWAIGEIVGLVSTGINHFINLEKEASDAAQTVKEESSQALTEDKETSETLDELIKKYKELRETSNYDENTKKNVLDIQDQITNLVGVQAKNLDLVNGKLDTQLEKLEKIKRKQAKKTLDDSEIDYYSTKDAANKLVGDASTDGFLGTGLFSESGYDFVKDYGYYSVLDPDSDFSRFSKILGKAGYDDIIKANDSFTGFEIKAKGNSAKEKEKYLQGKLDALRSEGETNNDLFTGVSAAIKKYTEANDEVYKSAVSYANTWLNSSEEVDTSDIASVTDFEKRRKEIIDKLQNTQTISDAIKDKDINKEDIEQIVDSYMSTCEDFSIWYEQWKNNLNDTSSNKTDTSSPLSFNKAWKQLQNGTGAFKDDDTVKNTYNELMSLAEAGKLTVDAFNNTTGSDTFLDQVKLSAEEATKKVNALVDETKQLSSMKTGITAITSAYDEKKDSKDNRVGSDTLNSLYGTLDVANWTNEADLNAWEQYKNIASDSKSSLTELKTAQDKLATSFVNSNNFLSNLNEENEDYYKNLLAEMGVTNANAVITDTLRKNRANNAIETYNELDAEKKNADELRKVERKLKGCTKEEKEYYFAKLLANGENLDTNEEREQLIKLAEDLDISGQMVDILSAKLYALDGTVATATVKVGYQAESGTSNDINGYNSNKGNSKSSGSMAGKTNQYFISTAKGTKTNPKVQDLAKQTAEQRIKGLEDKVTTSVQTKKGNKSDDTKDASSSSNSKTEIDWLERRINRLTSKISLLNAQKENLFSVKKKNSNLNKQITQTTKLINAYSAAITKYSKKAESINLSSSLKKKVQNGQITGSYKSLIKEYGETTANKIQKYQDYYDKAQSAKQSLAESKANKRALTEEKYQNYVDLYDSRTSRAEAKEAIAIGATEQNKAIATQIKNTKLSYDYQIKIANLTEDKAKADQLEYEKQKAIVDLKKQQIENLKTEYDNSIGLIDNSQQDANNKLSQMEARGQIIKSSYYSSLNNYENQKLSQLNSELSKLQAQQNTFTEYSQEWYDLQSDIQSVKNAINDAETAIIENNKKVGELRQAMYDDIASRNSNIGTEASFLAGLLGDNLIDDKTGNFTKDGLATLGTYAINMEANTSTALSYKKDREELEKQIADYKNGNSHALDAYGSLDAAKKALDEIIQKQQDAISAEYANEKQIYDLMTQRYETQLSYMQSIIDAKKKLLDMEKDLYDYERNINNQTKNIASLEKQLTALQGDDSESGRLRRSQLQQSLDEANQELQDTEYERYISDQQNMLDNLYSQYEDLIHELEKNFEKVVNDGVEKINSKSGEISDAITDYATNYGYNPSNDMKSILGALGSSGDGDVTTLPGTINNGFSNLGTIFQKGVTDIVNAYNGSKSDNNNSNNGSNNSSNPTNEQQSNTADYEEWRKIAGTLGGTTQKLPENYANQILNGIKSGQSNTTKVETTAERNKKIQSAISYINSHLSTAKKKKSEYSAVNQSFYSKWGKKVLSDSELKNLAGIVGVTYNNASKTGNLYKRLKDLGIAGFKRGGIGQLVKASGEDGLALVRNGEGFIAPEHVESIKNLMNIVPDMTQFTKTLTNIKPVNRNIGNTFGDIVINAELPNVQNSYDLINDIQNNRKVQQALTIVTKDVIEKGVITNNIQSVR